MPFISVEAVHPSAAQKERLVAELTRVSSEILGVPQTSFYVLVKENDAENWGVGGKQLSQIFAEKQADR